MKITGAGANEVAREDGRGIEGRKSGRLSDRIRIYVLDQIVSGALKPGAVIQIAALAQEVGVSRTPAREALLSLQDANFLEVIPNHGFLVKHVSLPDVRDIYVMRRTLEGATAERAATRLTSERLARLTKANEQARSSAVEAPYSLEMDALFHSFHLQIAEVAASPRLFVAVQGIFRETDRLRSVGANPPDPREVAAEHQGILDALASGDPSLARRVMEDHIDSLRASAILLLTD